MSRPTEDIYVFGLDMLTAAVDATSQDDAAAAVRALASDLTPDDLRRVVAMLAVETVWQTRPRRSRRALREWIFQRKLMLLEHSMRGDHG